MKKVTGEIVEGLLEIGSVLGYITGIVFIDTYIKDSAPKGAQASKKTLTDLFFRK